MTQHKAESKHEVKHEVKHEKKEPEEKKEAPSEPVKTKFINLQFGDTSYNNYFEVPENFDVYAAWEKFKHDNYKDPNPKYNWPKNFCKELVEKLGCQSANTAMQVVKLLI